MNPSTYTNDKTFGDANTENLVCESGLLPDLK